tara:strand:+ start:87 stop:596 length:510 start_codon:yes stop_codon:yes gene_type:complete
MKIIIFTILSFNIIFSECTPFEVATYINKKDGWQFPYSTFYNAMSSGVFEIQQYNDECFQLLENNSDCILSCIYMEQDELDYDLGRIGCIYYNCPDGESLVQNYEEHYERPTHLYGQLYCSGDTTWNSDLDLCESNICNGDLNQDNNKDVTDIVILVQEVLNGSNSCVD